MLPMVTVVAVAGSYIEPVYRSPEELREVKAILHVEWMGGTGSQLRPSCCWEEHTVCHDDRAR